MLCDQFHLVDPAVTGFATDTGSQVQTVIEVRIVRQLVYAHPFNRATGRPTLPHSVELVALDPDQGMAVHAYLGGRDRGYR